MNQSANVIMVCTPLDKPLSNDVNLQSVTQEKDLNVINNSLLCISNTQGQKEVINNCKSNLIKYPSAFDHLDFNLGSKVISDCNSLTAIPVKPKTPKSVYGNNLVLSDQRSNNNKVLVKQGLSGEKKLQVLQFLRDLQFLQGFSVASPIDT